ncbi:MAG: phage holin family protein [Planctomycetes bacterium]|nr:phage holin family protein [Planctomycetota bacterium]
MSEPPKSEGLLDRTLQFLTEAAAECLKQPIAEVGRWARRKVLLFGVGLVLLCTALVFLLVGGVQGLQSIDRMPPWVPYLGVGALAAIAGVVVLSRE